MINARNFGIVRSKDVKEIIASHEYEKKELLQN